MRPGAAGLTVCGLKKTNKDKETDNSSMDLLKKSPGTLLILPFVAILGLDLLLNILFLTKLTVDYFVLGQAPSTETWF